MAATLTDPLLGHLIDGRYEVLSRIARGGMATVYLATDRRLDREVAIKVMHPHLAEGGAGSEFVARFRREARAAARLTHPGLVGVLDQGVDGETSYLTMEYIDGTNLRRHLGERGSLSVEEAFATAEAVLDALAAAHRAGLVHRDVKPENILLAADGRIKVADFGLARAVTEVTATTAGTILGTVAYLAPELVAHGSSDARTDVYAVGILLYEMLTGAQPFTGSTPIQVAYQHVNNDIPAPSDAVDWLPVEVDDLVRALAARTPDERPAHAGAALAALRRTRSELDEGTLARRADVEPSIVLPQATAAAAHDDAPQDAPAGTQTAGAPHTSPDDPDATDALNVPRPHRTDPTHPGNPTDPSGPADPEGPPHGSTMALRIGSGVQTLEAPEPANVTAARRRRRIRLVVALTLLVAALAGGWWWFMTSGPGAYTQVPTGLVAAELPAAESALEAVGLQASPTEVFDPTVPAGTVVTTSPDEGERIRKEGTVDLAVSKGPDLREVPPDLVGKPLVDVRAALEGVGLVVPEPARAYDDTVPAENVLSLSAEPGAQLPVDTAVALTVSDGPEPLSINSVIGVERDAAVKQLTDQGLLVVADATDYSQEYAAGEVMAQSPEPGAAGHRMDTVTLTVSLGPPLVKVPDVVGKTSAEATAALQAAGLVAKPQKYLGGLFDRVRFQDVEANSTVAMGTVVTITVW